MAETGNGIRVLVVDDYEDAAETMCALLSELGYASMAAYDAPTALSIVKDWKPQAVLFDVLMPQMDGVQLAHRLRDQTGQDVVLVAVSGHAIHQDDRVKSAYLIADHFLEKPLSLEKLARVLPGG